MYEIIVSPTFKISLNRLTSFLEYKYSPEKAIATRRNIKIALENKLGNNPYLAPISNRLVDLGIKDYRQFIIDEHNVVFYRVNEEHHQVKLFAIMDTRQSIQKLLSEVLLRL